MGSQDDIPCSTGVTSDQELRESTLHLLLVYGTLRPGLENFPEMEGGHHVGPGRTLEKYSLYADAELPYLSRTPATSHITGDIFEVTSPHLERLDRFEGHPTWYRREMVPVITAGGGLIQCWTYFCLSPAGAIVKSGDYVLYRTSAGRVQS